jgi:hypothetical protein
LRNYLQLRLQAAGCTGVDPFSRLASWLLALLAGGSIARIELLAERAMLAALSRGARKVRWHHVRRARATRSRGFSAFGRMSAGLVSGVLAGAGLAFAASQFLNVTPETVQSMPGASTPLKRQDVDERRQSNANPLRQGGHGRQGSITVSDRFGPMEVRSSAQAFPVMADLKVTETAETVYLSRAIVARPGQATTTAAAFRDRQG